MPRVRRGGSVTSPAGTVQVPWHARHVADVEESFATSPHGLRADEVAARLAQHGPNVLREQPPTRAIVVFLRQFSSTFILILMMAAAVTLAMGELLDTAMIVFALLLNLMRSSDSSRSAAPSRR